MFDLGGLSDHSLSKSHSSSNKDKDTSDNSGFSLQSNQMYPNVSKSKKENGCSSSVTRTNYKSNYKYNHNYKSGNKRQSNKEKGKSRSKMKSDKNKNVENNGNNGNSNKSLSKSKKRKRKKSKNKNKLSKKNKSKSLNNNNGSRVGPAMSMGLRGVNGNTDGNNKSLPIITEEDNESNFSASYIPTQYDASGYFSYHTWGNPDVRPPNEDKIVRAGPSLWQWDWDLSFGLYDDLYDDIKKQHRRSDELFLEETWLRLEGPVPSWQPLLAAILWFVASINILYPVSIIAESTKSPWDYHNNHANSGNGGNSGNSLASDWNPLSRKIHINSNDHCHLLCAIIFASYEIGAWISLPIARRFVITIGPNSPLLIGFMLLCASQFILSQCYRFYNLNFVLFASFGRVVSGIGFTLFRQSSLFYWSYFPKLDMLASGLGFCIGPVFGDLIFVYAPISDGWQLPFFVYGCILGMIVLLLIGIFSFGKLTVKDVSKLDIPEHVRSVRKPRYDLLHINVRSPSQLYIFFKCEILFLLVIGLTALEPTLPVYALDPTLLVVISGSLFTFIYLPLLALASLMGLIYSKSNVQYLKSPKKHLEERRRGMKYLTKTLSINFIGRKTLNSNNNNGNNKFGQKGRPQRQIGMTKSEKIRLVERPQWLTKKKKLLPSPDIDQHHIMMLFGLIITSIGYILMSGISTVLTWHSKGGSLVAGLIIVSIGSALSIVSICDSFVNGLSLHTNQVNLMYLAISVGVIVGPIVGGYSMDLANHEFNKPCWVFGVVLSMHFAIYLIYQIGKWIKKFIQQTFFPKNKYPIVNKNNIKNENEIEKKEKEKIVSNNNGHNEENNRNMNEAIRTTKRRAINKNNMIANVRKRNSADYPLLEGAFGTSINTVNSVNSVNSVNDGTSGSGNAANAANGANGANGVERREYSNSLTIKSVSGATAASLSGSSISVSKKLIERNESFPSRTTNRSQLKNRNNEFNKISSIGGINGMQERMDEMNAETPRSGASNSQTNSNHSSNASLHESSNASPNISPNITPNGSPNGSPNQSPNQSPNASPNGSLNDSPNDSNNSIDSASASMSDSVSHGSGSDNENDKHNENEINNEANDRKERNERVSPLPITHENVARLSNRMNDNFAFQRQINRAKMNNRLGYGEISRQNQMQIDFVERQIAQHKQQLAKQNKKKKRSHAIYIHGRNLLHLCWWKRGMNVRFPYIQWLDSGWSKTHQKQKHSFVTNAPLEP